MTIAVPHSATSFEQAVDMMADAIRGSVSAAQTRAGAEVLRLEVPLAAGSLSPLPWLEAQVSGTITYWSGRQDGFEMAGVGVAHVVRSEGRVGFEELFSSLARYLPQGSGLRFYGGMRFDISSLARDTKASEEWRPFGSGLFVMPRFEVVADGAKIVLACNLPVAQVWTDVEAVLGELSHLRPLPGKPSRLCYRVTGRGDLPDRTGWDAIVTSAVRAVDGGQLEKVVLARRTTLELSGPLNPLALLSKLKARSVNCYHFCFEPPTLTGAPPALIGASPERLYLRTGPMIHTEAVAGTRPRGNTDESDTMFENELLSSEKDRMEQEFVARFIASGLERLCDSVRSDGGPRVLKAANVQHLVTRFEGQLRAGVSDAHILTTLHPTPAVGGVPTDRAAEFISRIEPFDRGWYAGPVGWVGPDAAEFSVAIRSALLADDSLRLYAGGGMVSGSTPPEEWREIESKISNFLKVVTES
jgi:menaquinone-specific isochorismate synthase